MNSLVREGAGTPVRIQPEDFSVYRTEQLTQSSIVLMVDMSRSDDPTAAASPPPRRSRSPSTA